MMPIPKIRAKRFNRMPKDEYISWLSNHMGVEADSTVYSQTTRMQIDDRLEYLMSQLEEEHPGRPSTVPDFISSISCT